MRPDPNFDTLISKIYPSRDEYEQHQERVLAKLHKNHNHASLISSIEEGIKLQSQNRQKSRKGLPEEGGIERTPNTGANNNNNNTTSTNNTGNANNNDSISTTAATPTTNSNNNQSSAPSTPTSGEIAPVSTGTTISTSNPTSSTNSTGSFSGPKSKKSRSSVSAAGATSENESGAGSSVEGTAGDEADGPGDFSMSEIELVFRPHPLEMNEDNELIRELKDSSIRYIKTTANATGKEGLLYNRDIIIYTI